MANEEYQEAWKSRYIDGLKSISIENWYGYCDFITDIILVTVCDPNKASLDVGCSKGRFTGWMAHLSNRAIAFDPSPLLLEFKNIWNCWWCEPHREKTIYISTAVGDKTEIGTYHRYKDLDTGENRPGWASMLDNPYKNPKLLKTEQISIPIDRLDNLFSGPVGFIKIDTEGYDINALRGASKIIAENRPVMVIETDRTTPLIKELNSIGYLAWPMAWPLAGPITDQGLCMLDVLAIPAEKSSDLGEKIRLAVNPYVEFTANQLDTTFDYPENVRWVSAYLRKLLADRLDQSIR